MRRTAAQIFQGAKALAPRGDHQHGSGRTVAGPTLQASLTQTPLRVTQQSVSTRIGSKLNYAATVHQGSRAHVIRAKGKMLKFRWERGNLLLQRRSGRSRAFFFFKQVRHPGNRQGRRFLTTPMVQYGRANGFRTISSVLGRTRLPYDSGL